MLLMVLELLLLLVLLQLLLKLVLLLLSLRQASGLLPLLSLMRLMVNDRRRFARTRAQTYRLVQQFAYPIVFGRFFQLYTRAKIVVQIAWHTLSDGMRIYALTHTV